jgi:hypothetical protein
LNGSELLLGGYGYGILPSPLLTGYEKVTIEFWATYSTENTGYWQRTFFFGSQTDAGTKMTGIDYSHNAPSTPNGWQNLEVRAIENDITNNMYSNIQGGLNGSNNIHVTCVIDPANNAAYFYNGTVARYVQHGNVPSLSGINEVYGLIGKSGTDVDPVLRGSINEFRIYNGDISRSQLALNDAAGPDTFLTSPGTLISLEFTSPHASISIGQKSQQILKGNFSEVTGLDLILYGGATLQSLTPTVLSVSETGLVTGLNSGEGKIVASYGGMSITNTIEVGRPILKHRYSFDTDASDSVGTAHGSLEGGSTVVDGKAVLAGAAAGATGPYVNLPGPTIDITSYEAVTFDVWATIGAGRQWSRLFNFGESTMTQIYFTPRASVNNEHRFAMGGTGRTIEANRNLNGQTVHLTAVIDPISGVMALYKDGVLEHARYDAFGLLSQIRNTTATIGKSEVPADPYLAADIDEFRIYQGAMSPQEVARSHAAGPNSVSTDPGALQSITVVVTNYPSESMQMPPVVLANYANHPGLNLLPNISARVDGLELTSSDTNILMVLPNDMIRTFGEGQVTLTANLNGKVSSALVNVSSPGAQLTHRYSFNGDANDSIGTAHGTLSRTNAAGVLPTIADGKVLMAGAGGGFVSFPAGLVTDYNGVTIDTWVDVGDVGAWARLWFFGNNQRNEFYITPRTGGAAPNHRYSTGFVLGGGTTIENPEAFLNNSLHVTAVFGQGTMALYTNGVLEQVVPTDGRVDQIGVQYSWLGRSPYPADPTFVGAVDEFRIYNGRLTPEQILEAHQLGPNTLPATSAPVLAASVNSTEVILTWPLDGTGYKVQATGNLTGTWTPLDNTPVSEGGQWKVSIPRSLGYHYFRLWK